MKKQCCYVFLVHFVNDIVINSFKKISSELKYSGNLIYIVCDKKHKKSIESLDWDLKCYFIFSDLKKNVKTIGENIVPGNCHLRNIWFFEQNREYDYYWFIEYDVTYTGNWNTFFSQFEKDSSDLIASRLSRIDGNEQFAWWSTLNFPEKKTECNYAAFLPIHRLSKKALKILSEKVGQGWVGHFEALVPTAVITEGLTASDIGGNGAFTPFVRKNKNYLDSLPFGGFSRMFSTMRPHPAIYCCFRSHCLYHPIKKNRKNIWFYIYNFIKLTIRKPRGFFVYLRDLVHFRR